MSPGSEPNPPGDDLRQGGPLPVGGLSARRIWVQPRPMKLCKDLSVPCCNTPQCNISFGRTVRREASKAWYTPRFQEPHGLLHGFVELLGTDRLLVHLRHAMKSASKTTSSSDWL